MNIFRKIGCSIIGWDSTILSHCGEASVRQYHKLLAAICIMVILWGTIGYCFADNYINIESQYFKLIVSCIFMFIIVCIERVIILTVGKARFMGFIRVLLAFVMATLGSTVFDQMIFRNDIAEQLALNREELIRETVRSRVGIIDERIAELRSEQDSLGNVIEKLSREVVAHPVIKSVNVSRERVNTGQLDEDGKPIISYKTTTSEVTTENPLTGKLRSSQELYKDYERQLDDQTDKKMHIQEMVANEILAKKPGFIEELRATVDVVSKSGWTIAFYALMFAFLLLLETFVVSIKLADTKCDYDLIVEHQLEMKKLQLKAGEEQVRNKYVTKQLNSDDQ